MDKLNEQLNCSIHGDFERGWKLVQELEKERPNCNRCAFNRGWYVLGQGKLNKGMELISRGRFESVFGSPHIGTSKPIYRKENLLNNNFVLLHLEGGFGDEMIGVRFAKEIKKLGGRCILSCHPNLMSLFSRVEGVISLINSESARAAYFDYWIPAMSAEYVLGHEYDTLPNDPYIKADIDYINKFKEIIKTNKFKIGIRYVGNPEFEHEQHRVFPEELMFNLFEDDNIKNKVQVYSLQKDLADKKHLPEHVIDLEPHLQTWEDTAGAIENLDLVISSCTSVAHLSSAMGKPTWVVVPILSYYIWAYKLSIDPISCGEFTSYYKTTRLFRQEKYGSWIEPFENVKRGLENIINARHNLKNM